jgi:CIC family chloride channel protein
MKHPHPRAQELGDFTTDWRVLPISLLAIFIGLIGTTVAWALLRLIGLFTNLFYYHRWNTALVSPAWNPLGGWAILVPVAGSLIIGLMARYGSERIRGHGIPEALESILVHGSRVAPRLAILKPLSSAISIGSGGPFGAEGPIIMTGGAFGSMLAQFFHLTSVERKTLLVAGAAAGMSATFASPIAAVLLAVELLLFEWKPRSLVPVALASATAGAARRYILGIGPLFLVPTHPVFIGSWGLLGCVVCGVLAGALSALLTGAVYAAEDAFLKLNGSRIRSTRSRSRSSDKFRVRADKRSCNPITPTSLSSSPRSTTGKRVKPVWGSAIGPQRNRLTDGTPEGCAHG